MNTLRLIKEGVRAFIGVLGLTFMCIPLVLLHTISELSRNFVLFLLLLPVTAVVTAVFFIPTAWAWRMGRFEKEEET